MKKLTLLNNFKVLFMFSGLIYEIITKLKHHNCMILLVSMLKFTIYTKYICLFL